MLASVPSLDPPAAPTPSLTPGAIAKVGDPTVSISGTVLDQFITFEYAGQKLTTRIVRAPSPHLLVDLPLSISARQGAYTIVATTSDGRSSRYQITIN